MSDRNIYILHFMFILNYEHNFELGHPRCACKLMVVKVSKKHNSYVRIGVIFF